MSSIAYVTDYKMLDNLRLNEKKTMNFWRLSTKTNFSDFKEGDLLFFLSKNKDHLSSNKEKGIIGFGRVASMHIGSIRAMWNKYHELNGFNSLNEFREAILKVSKDHLLPEKITSFYLEEVSFFQSPLYLSEFGVNISKNVESYVYIINETVIKILEASFDNEDLWSSDVNYEYRLRKEILSIRISEVHKLIKDGNYSDSKKASIRRMMLKLAKEHYGYRMVSDSCSDIFRLKDNEISFIFYKDKNTDIKELIGKAFMYRYYLKEYELSFKTIDNDEQFMEIVNN